MNGFASIGLGQALSRGFRRRNDAARALTARETVLVLESDYRAWQAVGSHPADASADYTIARLRTMTGAGRLLERWPATALSTAAMGG